MYGTCQVCGCTQNNACRGANGGCYWVNGNEKDLCSECAPITTATQRQALRRALETGNPLAGRGSKQNAGGSYRRMIKRLIDLKLLAYGHPHRITRMGCAAIGEPMPDE